MFSMITVINESKILTKPCIFTFSHANGNIDLMKKYVIQINDAKAINVNVNVKNFMYVKMILFGILLHITVKMENI